MEKVNTNHAWDFVMSRSLMGGDGSGDICPATTTMAVDVGKPDSGPKRCFLPRSPIGIAQIHFGDFEIFDCT